MSSAHELVNSAVRLISLPDVYLRVKALLDDPNSSSADVAKAIAQDPGLTARLLRIANSAFFGFAAKIETVSRAITMLGTQQLHDLVLATSVARAFSGMSCEIMNVDLFWRDSVYCGVVSRLLATRCNVLDSERLFVEGLLRDIGHLIMYQKIPKLTQQALIRSQQAEKVLFRVERGLIGFDYAQVGGELMRAWGLPSSLQQTVQYHPEPAKGREFPLETCIVHIASHITTAAAQNDPISSATLPVDPEAWRITGLAQDIVEPITQEADQQLAETVDLIFPKNERPLD